MASKAAYKRLTKEYLSMQRNPPPYITAKPLESNILEWHYVLRGPPDTPYEGGEYHGKLKFPSDYPYKPPAIQVVTPSGRFQTNTNICMSMSNFHPNTWNPAWSVSTILNGMLSFMVEDEVTTGSIRTSVADRKALSKKSHAFNLANPRFRQIFPELCTYEPAPLPNFNSGTDTKDNNADNGLTSISNEKDIGAKHKNLQPSIKLTKNDNPNTHDSQPGIIPGTRAVANSEVPSGPVVAVAPVPAHTNNRNAWRVASELPLKWVILIVLIAYVFASKLVSRLLTT